MQIRQGLIFYSLLVLVLVCSLPVTYHCWRKMLPLRGSVVAPEGLRVPGHITFSGEMFVSEATFLGLCTVVSVVATTAPTSALTIALTILSNDGSKVAPAFSEGVNCTHEPKMSPTSGESSGDTNGYTMRVSPESVTLVVCAHVLLILSELLCTRASRTSDHSYCHCLETSCSPSVSLVSGASSQIEFDTFPEQHKVRRDHPQEFVCQDARRLHNGF